MTEEELKILEEKYNNGSIREDEKAVLIQELTLALADLNTTLKKVQKD